MLTAAENDALVLDVLGDRFRLPMARLVPGRTTIVEEPESTIPVRAFTMAGGTVIGAAPEQLELVRDTLTSAANLDEAMRAVAAALGTHAFSGVARTGVDITPPAGPIAVLDVEDPRLPEWVRGHFTGDAWCVLDDAGEVLSCAVLKRYDERLREIAVGTAEAARGRGLAKNVTAAAALAVLSGGRAVLYNHAIGNAASAKVAQSVGLNELGCYFGIVGDRRMAVELGEDDSQN